MSQRKPFLFIFLIATAATITLFQNCTNNYKLNTSGSNSTLAATGTGTITESPPGDGTGTITQTAPTIQTFHPALAVRDTTCIACHAQINSSLITDFGYPDAWFVNGQNGSTDFGYTHYYFNTWQAICQITGQVIVPQATVPSGALNVSFPSPAPATMDLASLLTATNIDHFSDGWHCPNVNPPNQEPLTFRVTPPTGQSAVIAESSVYIGAPTASEILALVPNSKAVVPWVQVVGTNQAGLSGLNVVTGVNGNNYVSNVDANGNSIGTLKCSGKDVVINGTLLLSNAQILAESKGCRLYVTGSVFIYGPITYLNSGTTADPTDNLQITSATSIILGVGLSGSVLGATGGNPNQPLQIRLQGDVRGNMVLRRANTPSNFSTYATAILTEGQNIGGNLLVDASNYGSLPTAQSGDNQTRAAIDFQHLLLNAPLIHSRYLGTTTGVIVAESATFSLGEFSYAFDPVFQTVPILPALKYDILCTSATGCTPADP